MALLTNCHTLDVGDHSVTFGEEEVSARAVFWRGDSGCGEYFFRYQRREISFIELDHAMGAVANQSSPVRLQWAAPSTDKFGGKVGRRGSSLADQIG